MRKLLTIFFLLISLSVFSQTNYYVSPTGDNGNAGTIGSPWALPSYAVTQTGPGDTVFLRGGTIYETARVHITASHDGTEADPLVIMSYPGEWAVLDYVNYTQAPSSGPGSNTYSHGILIDHAGFIKFKNFELKNVLQQVEYTQAFGIFGSASHNLTYNNIIVHDIGGRGFFHETPWGYDNEPEYDTTRYINCDAYQCSDSIASYTGMAPTDIGNAADGFKEYGEVGSVIYYTGCRAWACSDDGWDGGSGTVQYMDNCWSFDNGDFEGDGNGFKLGGHENAALNALDPILTTLRNCISAFNRIPGYFWLEYNPYYRIQGRMYNTISYNDGGSAVSTSNNELEGRENIKWQVYNSIFYSELYDPENIYSWNAVSAAYLAYTESHNNFDYIGGFPGWEFTDTVTFIPASDWVVSNNATILSQLMATRKANGNLPDLTAFRLSGSSDLIGAGKDIGMTATPDIGIDWTYYDLTYGAGIPDPPDPETDYVPTIYSNNATDIKSIIVTVGGNVTSDGGATVTQRGVVWSTSASPDLTDNVITTTGTTGIYSVTINNLKGNTTYYVRAYATNAEGTAYGSEVSFTTSEYTQGLTNGKVGYTNGKISIIK